MSRILFVNSEFLERDCRLPAVFGAWKTHFNFLFQWWFGFCLANVHIHSYIGTNLRFSLCFIVLFLEREIVWSFGVGWFGNVYVPLQIVCHHSHELFLGLLLMYSLRFLHPTVDLWCRLWTLFDIFMNSRSGLFSYVPRLLNNNLTYAVLSLRE